MLSVFAQTTARWVGLGFAKLFAQLGQGELLHVPACGFDGGDNNHLGTAIGIHRRDAHLLANLDEFKKNFPTHLGLQKHGFHRVIAQGVDLRISPASAARLTVNEKGPAGAEPLQNSGESPPLSRS